MTPGNPSFFPPHLVDEIVKNYNSTLPKGGGIAYLVNQMGMAITAAMNALRAQPVVNLDQTISETPTQAEVQAISDKVDELLNAMRNAGLLSN